MQGMFGRQMGSRTGGFFNTIKASRRFHKNMKAAIKKDSENPLEGRFPNFKNSLTALAKDPQGFQAAVKVKEAKDAAKTFLLAGAGAGVASTIVHKVNSDSEDKDTKDHLEE